MPLVDTLLCKEYPLPDFICQPFVARGGITLLHGKKSLGKSPFSWELARCVANGLPFLGFPTSKGRVLFIEKDTPEQLSMSRIRKLPEPQGNWYVEFMTKTPVNLADFARSHTQFEPMEKQHGPFDLVIWNPLARLYVGTDRDVVMRVYDSMTGLFPCASHLLVSHDRKEGRSLDSVQIDSEEHSGWQEWVNLAQNVFRLTQPGEYLELRHTGSQTGKKSKPIRFSLTCDNSSVGPYHRIENVAAQLASMPGKDKTEQVKNLAKTLKKSVRTIWRALADEESDDTDVSVENSQ